MVMMASMDEHESKVVLEFCHLLEKSKHLFNGLRDLPHYGPKQWQAYFCRAFDIYTKLWKFQQQHRQVFFLVIFFLNNYNFFLPVVFYFIFFFWCKGFVRVGLA